MHRVRVGALGLACVFLLVMLATALLRLSNGDELLPDTSVNLSNTIEAPTEPLAELGVAPGNPAADAAPPAKQPHAH